MNNVPNSFETHSFLINIPFESLTDSVVVRCSEAEYHFEPQAIRHVNVLRIEINQGTFEAPSGILAFPSVTVVQHNHELLVTCSCGNKSEKLCENQALILTALMRRDELAVFFNSYLRKEKIRKVATNYGLEYETDLDKYFNIEYQHNKLNIYPLLPNLVPVTPESLETMRRELALTPNQTVIDKETPHTAEHLFCVVFRRHKFYKYLIAELYKAPKTKDGKIKNPLVALQPVDYIWETDDPQHLKFYSAIARFQNHPNNIRSESDITALRAIIKNPLGYDIYYHNEDVSENVSASSLVAVGVKIFHGSFELSISQKERFFNITASIAINGKILLPKDVMVCFSYFIETESMLYLVDKLPVLSALELLKKNQGTITVHESKYNEFRTLLLKPLEDKVRVNYQYIEPATPKQLRQQGFTNEVEKIIYLSDFGQHVMIIPVIRYGDIEIPVLTRRQIFAYDDRGKEFLVKRNRDLENAFTALILKQHPDFEEQLEYDLHYFYLHKRHFLDEKWFLDTFEEWQHQNITVLGFNDIKDNKLNPNKINVDIKVLSGINWFNTVINVRFGKKKASLKQIQKSLRNKSKYVQLDDGTLGILPTEWIEKFSKYFNAGDIANDEQLHIPRINYSAIEQFYQEDMFDEEVKKDLKMYHDKLANFNSIENIEIPRDLTATLRPYQKQGLNWLNFLDHFNFGGCLADDMGLGKSIQIIAFILSQRERTKHNTNLLVVPTTLIFNWKKEVEKFAPSLKLFTIYGSDRIKSTEGFGSYEIILTSYGTLLSDINFMKDYTFNYIFLDESHNIKNPETQRYKVARMLRSRNKIVITGTPVENNTFDIYGQFSFACPGLLGGKRYFRDVYSIPIDKFKSSKRAAELQNKIKPFILRRTKDQVASELPDKTEIVLYCEMKEEQQKIYDAYEKEFREYISATSSEELSKRSMNVLKGLTRLRQICDSPKLLGNEMAAVEASSKIDMLIDQIEGKASDHKMLIFSQFVSMLDLIRKELAARKIRYSYLTGSTRNREAVVNEFQETRDIRVFLISLKAGGTGLNLTEADMVFLVDPWWNPAVENQAIDRTHRIGQNKKIVAARLISPGTVEEKIMQLQESKRELVHDLITTEDAFFKSLTKEDLLRILE